MYKIMCEQIFIMLGMLLSIWMIPYLVICLVQWLLSKMDFIDDCKFFDVEIFENEYLNGCCYCPLVNIIMMFLMIVAFILGVISFIIILFISTKNKRNK